MKDLHKVVLQKRTDTRSDLSFLYSRNMPILFGFFLVYVRQVYGFKSNLYLQLAPAAGILLCVIQFFFVYRKVHA